MTLYADPRRCPDCRAPIEYGADSCPSCGLVLAGPTARDLFVTLTRADQLLQALRSQSAGAPSPEPADGRVGRPQAGEAGVGPAPVESAAPYGVAPGTLPLTAPGALHPRRGLSAASVPRILLTLGAVCLLVAALVFLAYTWSVMGVGGRTATLVGFTAASGGLTAWMARRGLRAAAESLGLVSLGLLTLDLFGARHAGWLGAAGDEAFLLVLGLVLAVASVGAALAVRRTPAAELVGAESVTGVAAFLAGLGVVRLSESSGGILLATLLAAAGTVAVHRLRLRVASVTVGAVTGLSWLALALTGFARAQEHATLHGLWVELEVWPLLAAALLAGLVALVRPLPLLARLAAAAVAGLLVGVALLLPFAQGSATATTTAVAGLLAVACLTALVVPRPWNAATLLVLAAGAAWMTGITVELVTLAATRLVDVAATGWSGLAEDRLSASSPLSGAAPWTLAVAVVALAAVAVVAARTLPLADRLLAPVLGLPQAAAAAGVTALGVVALYAVPVWAVLTLALLLAVALVPAALVTRSAALLATGALFLVVAVGVGLHDEWLSAAALTTAVLLTAAVHLGWRQVWVAAVAGGSLALAVTAAAWAWGTLAGGAATWLGLVGLLVAAALVLGAPLLGARHWAASPATVIHGGAETGAGVAALAAGTAGVAGAAYDSQASWGALYLTVAGAAVVAMALLRADRREVGWLGGLLLVVASWVRLADLGVGTPEAYTLPSAVALLVVGLHHLRSTPGSTTLHSLTPGLAVGLAPSLAWSLADPVSLRSLLLGAACLGLLVGGLRLRWTAPVLFGAVTGALLVVRLAAPFVDAAVPRWVLIGAAGALLIAMGVTWERRLHDARALVGYMRHLR